MPTQRPALSVRDLSFNERRWLYAAIWKLIVVDRRVSAEEFDDLREAMSFVRKEEMEQLEERARQTLKPFNPGPLEPLSYDRAMVMMLEMLRVAAIDGVMVIDKRVYIERFAHLLGFTSDQAKLAFLELGLEMSRVEQKKIELRQSLRLEYLPDTHPKPVYR